MKDDLYFTRVPKAPYDALRHDEINFHMFTVMAVLHPWANWHTGTARDVSVPEGRHAV